ncbi:MAG: ammonia channel protein, partial [Arenicellales bacterium]
GGILGTLLAGIFSATSLGLFSGFGFAEGITSIAGQMKVQLIGVLATVAYTAIVSYVILKVVSLMTQGLRVTDEQEIQGLDIHMHEERGYDI